jgi:hypothetical protein
MSAQCEAIEQDGTGLKGWIIMTQDQIRSWYRFAKAIHQHGPARTTPQTGKSYVIDLRYDKLTLFRIGTSCAESLAGALSVTQGSLG